MSAPVAPTGTVTGPGSGAEPEPETRKSKAATRLASTCVGTVPRATKRTIRYIEPERGILFSWWVPTHGAKPGWVATGLTNSTLWANAIWAATRSFTRNSALPGDVAEVVKALKAGQAAFKAPKNKLNPDTRALSLSRGSFIRLLDCEEGTFIRKRLSACTFGNKGYALVELTDF